MSQPLTDPLLIVAVLAGFGLFILFGTRVFAFLGGIVDTWRPTSEHQARPGHENFGVAILFMAVPPAAFVWYGAATRIQSELLQPRLLDVLALVVVLLLVPLTGVFTFLRWKNELIDFDGDRISHVDVFGRRGSWSSVIRAKMKPPLGNAGDVLLERADSWIRADTSWINVRTMYEQLGRAGVPIEPWREKAQWKNLWG